MDVSLGRLKRVLARLVRPRPRPRRLDPATLPPGAADWLVPDNPRLVALKARYAAMDKRVTRPLIWHESRLPPEDMLYFRADNEFIWQTRGRNQNARAYARACRDVRARDETGLLDRLGEDDLFGAALFEVDGRRVSRELLDSVGEIDFLRRHAGLGAGAMNILDIGAGYGRLAWRLEQATGEGVRIFATDGFAPASFIAEFYLRHRRAKRAAMVPLDEVEALLAETPIDIAVNVHSFSECTAAAVAWWVELLARNGVPFLMVVPSEGTALGARCQINDGTDMEAILERFGYRIVVREPRYADPVVQKYGIDPVWLHLFALDRRGSR